MDIKNRLIVPRLEPHTVGDEIDDSVVTTR